MSRIQFSRNSRSLEDRENLSTALNDVQHRISSSSDIIEDIVDKLVGHYCEELDEYMAFIREVVTNAEKPPTSAELDDFALNIPVLLYFTGAAQESLGLQEDIAKAIRQEIFNDTYQMADGTIADKTSLAELASQAEYISHIAYQRAYKKVKLRMESANETLQSVKKVITRRIAEYGVTQGAE